jgi:sugar/nucleoside kinase (ribokinase family)
VKAIAMGVHVLDVLVRPVERIPEGQGGELVEQIRITAAGSAGGAALVLAKLGAEVDYLLPNAEQVLGLTGERDLVAGCRELLERGVGCVAATCGADGVVLVDAAGDDHVPAFEVDVVDTTGCGDAFSAGFLRGLSLGHFAREAAVLGCAVAAQVVGGLGSDHGDFDLDFGPGVRRKRTVAWTPVWRGPGTETGAP